MTEDKAMAIGAVIIKLGLITETNKLGDARWHALAALEVMRKAGFDVDGVLDLAKVKT